MLTYVMQFDNVTQVFLAALAYLCAIFFAISVHECAHGYIALRCGDTTARDSGRLTLNPRAHFSLVGIIIFLVAGIGFAKPVPVNFNNLKHGRPDVVKVSVAGVVSNLILAFLSAGLLSIVLAIVGNSMKMGFGYYVVFFVVQFCLISLIINIALIAFNLLPIFPLDGFRIVTAYSRPSNAFVQFMYRYGIYLLLGLMVIGSLFPVLDVFGYYMGFVQRIVLKLFSLIFPNLSFLGA